MNTLSSTAAEPQNNLSQAARAVATAINKLLCTIALDLGSDSDGEEELSTNEIIFKLNPHRINFTKSLDVINR